MRIRPIKIAEDEMSSEVINVSGAEMLNEYYLNSLERLTQEIRGIERALNKGNEEERAKTKEARDMAYQKTKKTVDELKGAQDKVKEETEKRKLKKIYLLFNKMMNRHFSDKVKEEKAKEQESIPSPEELAAPSPSAQALPPVPPPPLASSKNSKIRKIIATSINPENKETLEVEVKEDLLKDYAEKICQGLSYKHKNVTYKITPKFDEIRIYNEEKPILKIGINDILSINNVVPAGELYNLCPFHSVEFYQKYWKVVIESVGHFCIGDPAILIIVSQDTLPDVMRENKTHTIKGWNSKEDKEELVNISFKGERLIWIIEVSKEKINRTASLNDFEVMCTDENLKSLKNKKGIIREKIPVVNPDIEEVDVEFPNIGIIRLTTKQIGPVIEKIER